VIVRQSDSTPIKRIGIIMLMFVSWFALSNHCVLGASSASSAPVAKGCPMHMKSSGQTPTKQKGASDMPCCKTLRAIIVTKISAAANTLDFVLKPFSTAATPAVISQPSRCLLALDTGPPDALSFSEIVLQRSILAHAPPFLA
jgi:hypothetical protein